MKKRIGIFWGAFDPLTKAHIAIIEKAFCELFLDSLVIVVNNHSYKHYHLPLEKRIDDIQATLSQEIKKHIQITYQDDKRQADFAFLEKTYKGSLCAIAGSDAYLRWSKMTPQKDMALYETIAIVPRADDVLISLEPNSQILSIDPCYKYISSSHLKKNA